MPLAISGINRKNLASSIFYSKLKQEASYTRGGEDLEIPVVWEANEERAG